MSKKNPVPFKRCYAKHLGGCTGKSREHFISKCVLDAMGGYFTIQNIPWVKSGESAVVSSGALAATVLCDYHNSILSPYDSEAAKLFRHLMLLDSKATPEGLAEIPATLSINGIYLEKWLLKTLCGIMASGNFLIGYKPVGKVPPSEYLVNLLYTADPWNHSVGLYTNYAEGTDGSVNAFKGVAYDILVLMEGKEVEIVGIDVSLWGFVVLRGIFSKVVGPKLLSRYRPNKIQIVNQSVARDIVITWPAGSKTTQGPILTRTGTRPD